MDFIKVIAGVCGALDAEGVRYALIGGFAMALRGVRRATVDMDFILMREDLDRADAIFAKAGYRRCFRSENVSHYVAPDADWGRINVLHAFRGPSLGMLTRAERISVSTELSLPVVQVEDLIGLKVQAAVNDPLRRTGDWSDIRLMIEWRGRAGKPLDWELIGDYLEIFNLEAELASMREWYGEAH
jgi:hypothetical protein